jgi:L-fucose isomerase-like protein
LKKKSLKDFLEKEEEFFGEEIDTNDILEILHDINNRLDRIETKLEKILAEISKTTITTTTEEMSRKKTKSKNIVEEIMDDLRERGYISISSRLGSFRRREEIINGLKRLGAIEVDVGEDKYLFHPMAYKEFEKMLEANRIRDEVSAAEHMGMYKEVFLRLVKNGLIYFDVKKKKWAKV